MCTSFVFRKTPTIIGMNFDNNGMRYSIDKKHPGWFVVNVDGGRGPYPSFGVDRSGRFFNNLVVDSNGKGLYRRPSNRVTHTSKLIADILNGVILAEQLQSYLEKVEVVNTPDWSCHNMICDSNANVWIIEPGRGNIFSPAGESPFYVMTNTSLVDVQHNPAANECKRHQSVVDQLTKVNELSVDRAFEILEMASQTEGEWITAFSMVFSLQEHKVFYCHNRNFSERSIFDFNLPSAVNIN